MIIFDMDGVLVDACDWHRDALNMALKEVSNYEISREDHYSVFNGSPTKVKLQKLTEMGVVSAEAHTAIYELKQSNTMHIIERQCEVSSEKIQLIEWLKDQGVVVCCYTNSIRETASLMLEKTGILSSIDTLVTNQDVENPKPHPEGYLKILKQYKCAPENAIIVEDSPKGLRAAKEAGCAILEVKDATEVTIHRVKEFIDENFNPNGG
jgi:HAD superfamily hydrolase (TIGR01509 family)